MTCVKSYRQVGIAQKGHFIKNNAVKDQEEGDTKTTAPSIPSKYDAPQKILDGKGTNAFGARTLRFKSVVNSLPGPGQYYHASSYVKDAKNCGSVSARGYTTMISKTQRFSNLKELNDASLPGPGAYVPFLSFRNHFDDDIPNACFAKPKVVTKKKINQREDEIPGPGHYDVDNDIGKKTLSESNGSSFFKSTERRFDPINNESSVAVGSYEVRKSIVFLENYGKSEFPDPAFASTTERIAESRPKSPRPGPGDYVVLQGPNNFQMAKKTNILRRTGKTANVNIVKDNIETPGPGWYDLENIKFNNTSANNAESSYGFKSKVPRLWDSSTPKAPGPAYYAPKLTGKQSFFQNAERKWI
mmetsp:Transcript_15210/g.18524  ORF Transcript_15210/g.18524 Transcript_15210/m.18524 type:complete len:358 (+) Transcript_15210:137-1210(+)